MSNASSDLIVHKYVAEATLGVTPTTPALTKMNVVSSSIDGNISTTVSNQINSNRSDSDQIVTEGSTSGDIGIEWSYSSFDTFLESALGGTFTTATSVTGTDISASATDNSISSAGTAFTTSLFPVGSFIKATGFTGGNAVNNGKPMRVVSITTAKIVVAGVTIVDDAAGEAVVIKGGHYLKNGTTRKSFSIEKEFVGLSPAVFAIHRGMVVNTCSIDTSVGGIVNGSFGFNGLTTAYAATTYGTGAETAASSTEVFSPVNGVGTIFENDTALTDMVKSLKLSTNNNTRNNQALGSVYPFNINLGTLNVTGSLTAYFPDASLLTKVVNGTSTSLQWYLTDTAGNVFVVYLPKVKYSSGKTSGISRNSDVMQDLSFTALYDSTLGCSIQISSIAA